MSTICNVYTVQESNGKLYHKDYDMFRALAIARRSEKLGLSIHVHVQGSDIPETKIADIDENGNPVFTVYAMGLICEMTNNILW